MSLSTQLQPVHQLPVVYIDTSIADQQKKTQIGSRNNEIDRAQLVQLSSSDEDNCGEISKKIVHSVPQKMVTVKQEFGVSSDPQVCYLTNILMFSV